MDWLIAGGTFSLGLLIGMFIGYFVFEAEKMDHKVLYSAVGVMGGAAVIALFHLLGGFHAESRREYWLYPIGLLMGYVIGNIHERIDPPELYEARLEKRLKRLKEKEKEKD
jgi:uncharacterized membrane-anchored protein YhcB (DUF1043 family)